MDGNKRPVAEQELLITARKYDALIVLRFADDQFGKRAFMDETAQDKWAGSQDLDVEAMAAAILSGQEEGGIVTDMLRDRVDFPVMTLTAPVKDRGGQYHRPPCSSIRYEPASTPPSARCGWTCCSIPAWRCLRPFCR